MTDHLDARPAPEHDLERFLAGDLPPHRLARVRSAVARDPVLRDRLDRLEQSSREILAAYPPAEMAAAIRRRLERPAAGAAVRRCRWPWLVLASAATTAILVIGLSVPRPGASPVIDRIKGAGPSLVVTRWTPGGYEWLADGSVAAPGDVLRLGYRAGGRRFGAILSVDGSGTVTQHFPAARDRAVDLVQAGTTWLDTTCELDGTPRWTRFYLITGDHPFELGPLRESARTRAWHGSADAPPVVDIAGGLGQSVFSIIRRDAR